MDETLKMGTLGSGGAVLSGCQWLKKIISSPWTHFPPPLCFCHSFFFRFSLSPYQVPTLSSFKDSMQIYREKRLCKQRGRLKLTGLANKPQTLSYRLSGACVPFFIFHRTSVETTSEHLWMEPFKYVWNIMFEIIPYLLYLWRPRKLLTWWNWDFEICYTHLKTTNLYRTEIFFSFAWISTWSKCYNPITPKSEKGDWLKLNIACVSASNVLVFYRKTEC